MCYFGAPHQSNTQHSYLNHSPSIDSHPAFDGHQLKNKEVFGLKRKKYTQLAPFN